MLKTGKEILTKARKGKYGIGAYNFVNMEVLQAIIQAANEEKSPVIIQTTEGALKYMTPNYIKAFVQVIKQECKVPVAIHLDHGESLETVKKVIDWGYTSVMIDASHETYEKNVEITREVVKYAHKHGVTVEAELGTIGGVEDNISAKNIIYTDPKMALDFVKRTGLDYLAIAIGTSHGAYKFEGKTKLNYDILKKTRKLVDVPLVLHGASSIPKETVDKINKFGGQMKHTYGVDDKSVKEAIKNGICKINTDSDLRLVWTASIREVFTTKPNEFDLRKILGPAKENLVQYLKGRMRTLGSSGKA